VGRGFVLCGILRLEGALQMQMSAFLMEKIEFFYLFSEEKKVKYGITCFFSV